MNAAKAKAAAKLAKGKARAEAAAKNAAATTPTPTTPSNSSSTPTTKISSSTPVPTRARPSVTHYWADSTSSSVGEGGSILRIGYDQASFEKACKEVIEGVVEEEEEGGGEKEKVGEKEGEEKVEESEKSEKKEVKEVEVEVKVEEKKKVEVKKEDVALIVKELELTTKEAEDLLKKVGGDILKALWEATGPVVVATTAAVGGASASGKSVVVR